MFSTGEISSNEGDMKILKKMAGKIKGFPLFGETWNVITKRFLQGLMERVVVKYNFLHFRSTTPFQQNKNNAN